MMTTMEASRVRLAQISDRDKLAAMFVALWPDGSMEEHLQEIDSVLASQKSGTMPAAIFVSHKNDGELTGFLEVALRSHADGCDTAHPVGFVEGWFVYELHRGSGVGKSLMRSSEAWAREMGCKEMGSDTWIDHEDSQLAHRALGFEIVDRCVHFRKSL